MKEEQLREKAARRKGPSAMSTNYEIKHIGREGSKVTTNEDITHIKDGKGVPRARAHEDIEDDGKSFLA